MDWVWVCLFSTVFSVLSLAGCCSGTVRRWTGFGLSLTGRRWTFLHCVFCFLFHHCVFRFATTRCCSEAGRRWTGCREAAAVLFLGKETSDWGWHLILQNINDATFSLLDFWTFGIFEMYCFVHLTEDETCNRTCSILLLGVQKLTTEKTEWVSYNSHKWTLQGQVLLMLLHIKRICASKLLDQKFGKIVEEKRMKSKCNYVLYFVSNYTKRFLIISSIFTSSYRYVGGKGIPLESSTK